MPDLIPDSSPSSDGAALARFLYPAPARPRTAWGIFRWWERRRLAYNLVVGACGAVTLTGAGLLALIAGAPPGPSGLGDLLFPVLPVAIMANLCYTLGPIAESLLNKVWGREVRPVGPHLFRAGLVLSVGVTLVLPMILLGSQLVLWMLGAVFG